MSLDLWCQSDSFSIPPPLKTWFVWLLMCRRGLNAFLHLSMSFEPIFVGQFDFKRFRRNTGRATRTETSVTGHLAKHTQKGGGGGRVNIFRTWACSYPPPVGNPIQLLREKCVCVWMPLGFWKCRRHFWRKKEKKKKGFPTPLFLGGVFKGVGNFHVYVSTIQLDDWFKEREMCVCVLYQRMSRYLLDLRHHWCFLFSYLGRTQSSGNQVTDDWGMCQKVWMTKGGDRLKLGFFVPSKTDT